MPAIVIFYHAVTHKPNNTDTYMNMSSNVQFIMNDCAAPLSLSPLLRSLCLPLSLTHTHTHTHRETERERE